VIVYVKIITPRLQYIFEFIGKEIGSDFTIVSDLHEYKSYNGCTINYSNERIGNKEFFISACSLLFETSITPQQVSCFDFSGIKAFFKSGGDYPFDIFAASFYLLSRYEEYLPHKKDMYGRYAYENSLAFREGFLQLPLINTWIKDFKKQLRLKFPEQTFSRPRSKPAFIATYDIDQAYSYRNKSFIKNANGFFRSLIKGNWNNVKDRWNVLVGKAKDPFDAYQWMDQLNNKYSLKAFYFFIVAEKNGRYDKNISPSKKGMRDIIRHHAGQYTVGIHPSWQSGDDVSLIEAEKKVLEQISEKMISDSRQHYIRFTLPQTFRDIINAGIKNDFSMGYGSINGFRASVASSFYWFDLEENEATQLLLHPFCYMDANSFYEQHYTPQQAYEEMIGYYNNVKAVNGTMISIWHNNFLGADKLYSGWKEAYEKFIKEISS
jgi:hypothetical protein